jgi:hypothetical protein
MASLDDTKRRLSETAAFREMPIEMLGEIAQVVEDKVFPAKTMLFKGGDLRVNTKEGGVLVGKIEGNTIRITLPMRGEIVFSKSQ